MVKNSQSDARARSVTIVTRRMDESVVLRGIRSLPVRARQLSSAMAK